MVEALVEAADHVEDEGVVDDDLSKGSEVVSHLLEAPTVVGDTKVALNKVAKPCL